MFDVVGQSNEESCHCKEEVEKEEAEALVEALEQSSQRQLSLPFIPGLSRNDSQETIVIRVQEEVSTVKGSWLCTWFAQAWKSHGI